MVKQLYVSVGFSNGIGSVKQVLKRTSEIVLHTMYPLEQYYFHNNSYRCRNTTITFKDVPYPSGLVMQFIKKLYVRVRLHLNLGFMSECCLFITSDGSILARFAYREVTNEFQEFVVYLRYNAEERIHGNVIS